jgi:tRNA dimethylallyltransferase
MQYEKLGIVYLQEQLKTLDLAYFERLTNENPQTLQNPQRMMRFVEVCIGTGGLFLVLNQKQNERGFIPTI